MKNFKIHILLETIGTICWLLMDYCWMCGHVETSSWVGFIALMSLLFSFLFYDGNKVISRLSYATSFLWCLMNNFWMQSEYTELKHLLILAKGIFIIASILLILLLVLSKIKKELPDIKRLKIK